MPKIFFNLENVMWDKRVKSINQLSEMTGIGRPTLTAILKNTTQSVRLGTIITLCDHLDCDINDLLKYQKQEG